MGVRAFACLNSRDRNRLGFRRDLPTAAAYGVDRFLCVFGDRPASGSRSNDLDVRTMLDEARTFGASETFAGCEPFTVGATTRLGSLPERRQEADFLFVRASFDLPALLRWRESLRFDGVHLVPVGRSRTVAARLEQDGWTRTSGNRRLHQ